MVYSGGPYIDVGEITVETEMILGNLIKNGTFETGIVTPWVDDSNCFTHKVDIDNPHTETYSFHWLGTHNSLPCVDYIALHQTILGLLTSGSDMSFWVYEDNENTYGDGCTWVYVTITFSSGKYLHYLLWKYESGTPPAGNPVAEDANNGTFDLHNLAKTTWVEVSRNLHDDYTTKFGGPSGVNITRISVCSWNQNSNYEMHFDDAMILGEIEETVPIGPLNIPYSRVSDGIELITEKTITDAFIPYEWWFNYSGNFYLAETRGSDKSASIHLVAGDQIAGSVKEQITKQSSQRVRVVGRGESAEQDENTSEWQEDTSEMDNINGFYEKIETEKSISNKTINEDGLTESDIWAKVILAQNAPVRNEITLKLENDFYNANHYDVGDEVTATDPATGLSGKYRVKTIEKNINNSGGESVSVTLCKRRTDIIDRLSDLFKRMQKLQNASTYLDSMFAEGSKQTKLDPTKIDDIWEQTASNEWATELPEDKPANLADEFMVECDISGDIEFSCDKQDFVVWANADDTLGHIALYEPLLNFSRDPRFTCEFEIDSNFTPALIWSNNTFIDIGIRNPQTPTNPSGDCNLGALGFGFSIIKNSGVLELKAWEHDNVNARNVKVANISTDIKYIIEARVEWKERVVKYYFGRADVDKDDLQWGFRLRAILPMSLFAVDDYTYGAVTYTDYLCPFTVLINVGPIADRPNIVIYRWKTQAIRAVKP